MSQIKIIDPKTLKRWLDKGNCLLIDVREAFEFEEYHIAKAINLPLSQLLNKIQTIPDIKARKIVLQCAVGIRSMNGCLNLEKIGFDNFLWNLEGGIKNWANCGLPMVKEKK